MSSGFAPGVSKKSVTRIRLTRANAASKSQLGWDAGPQDRMGSDPSSAVGTARDSMHWRYPTPVNSGGKCADLKTNISDLYYKTIYLLWVHLVPRYHLGICRPHTHKARTHANDRIQCGQCNEHREPILIRPSPWWSAVDVMRAQRTQSTWKKAKKRAAMMIVPL